MPERALKILHIEDNPTDAFLMQELLRDDVNGKQFNLEQVDSLKSALAALRAHGYDAALLDLNLCDISGLDNVRAIKEQAPDLPVVVLTGVDNDTTALAAIDCGAQEFLVKGQGDGKVIRLAIHSSIKRKAVERKLFRQANYDEITGLPNRRLFQDYVEHALDRARRWKRHETILFLDLDHFKKVNDRFGHDVGNAMLSEVAIRLTSTLRKTDFVARYGGDEFVVLLDDHSPDIRSAAGQVVTKLLYAFNEPFGHENKKLEISASIGVAVYPYGGENYEALLKSADRAMYRAKKAGGRQFRFSALMPSDPNP